MVKKIQHPLKRRSVVKAILKDRGEKLLVTGLGHLLMMLMPLVIMLKIFIFGGQWVELQWLV